MITGRRLSTRRIIGFALLAVLIVPFTSACTYFRNRGNDAMDFIDLGVMVNDSWKPGLGVYFDFFSVTPLGFSAVDSQFYGLSHRRFGRMDYTEHCWGLVLWGTERRGIGEFDTMNPYHARADQQDLTDWPRFTLGPVGLAITSEPPPVYHYFECNRGLHLGWVGFDMTCRISEMLDFLVGWTTIDIMGDDE